MLIEEKKIVNKKSEGIPYTEEGRVKKDMSSWRVYKPVIDKSKCIKCLTCWLLCPDFAYEVTKEGLTKMRKENCKGCGICAEHCPVKCIKMVRDFHEK